MTYIDGDKGILRHRGYNIKTLAEKCDFLEVAYLLLNSGLPTKNQYEEFSKKISHHSLFNERLRSLFMAFRFSTHPMAIILAVVSSLSAFYPYFLNIYPDNSLGFTENFLYMMFTTPCEKYKINSVIKNALDKIFILHADHE